MNILITGTAGFIGYHLVKLLANTVHSIVGIDSINNYYDVALKQHRLTECGIKTTADEGEAIHSTCFSNYLFYQLDLCDKDKLEELFKRHSFDCVINLAAQAGVRYSLTNPDSYIASNVSGFMHILEFCQQYRVKN